MLKFFGIVGLVGAVAITYFATYGVGPEAQLPPEVSLLEGFREDGFLSEDRNLAIDERAEEAGVFEVPEGDAAVLAAAIAAQGDMGGMDMSGAAGDTTTMAEGMDMTAAADTATTMAEGMDMTAAADTATTMAEGMDMTAAADTATTMAEGMDMTAAADAATTMAEGMDMSGAESTGMAMGDIAMGEAGLGFAEEAAFDREIELTMTEWGFSEMSIDVKMGERIKFTVKNGGQIPHEFMFMSAPLMAAATYRATRADWNLLEHEALFEQSLVLPGGAFSFVLEVQANGSWMFMCMLPYHMQMGMMGQMATEGAAMDMAM